MMNVAVFGDVMLDEYSMGTIRARPAENGVPVMRIDKESKTLGGAAFVASQLAHWNCRVALHGRMGHDLAGKCIAQLLSNQGIHHRLLGGTSPTIVKQRIIANETVWVMRVDREYPLLPYPVMDDLKRYRAIIISDYGKGTVDDQLVRDVLASRLPIVVNACQGTCLDKYRDCHVVIRNRDGVDRVDCGRLGIGALIETDGSNGVTLYQADQEPRHVPAVAVDRVSDECGAGDVVTAMVAWYLARGFAPQDALLAAVRAAAVEIRHIGCQRVDLIDVYPSQIIECAEEISQWPRPLVIANGVFDLLHPGHVHLLRAARKCGRALLVLLNSDGSARRLKGQDRPVLNQHVRAGMLRDLPEVDGVMLFDEDTPVEIIKQLRPEVLVKGEKCSKPVPGAEFARRLYVVPELPNFSTTKLVGV